MPHIAKRFSGWRKVRPFKVLICPRYVYPTVTSFYALLIWDKVWLKTWSRHRRKRGPKEPPEAVRKLEPPHPVRCRRMIRLRNPYE